MATEAESINDITTLVREGHAALTAGDSAEARQSFRRVLELEPDNIEALIGMAGAVLPYREKRDYLQRALAIAPDHPEARAVLSFVEQKIAAGEVLAPRGVVVHEPLSGPSATSTTKLPVPEEDGVAAETLYCYIHPDRETGLRCTQCQRPICGQCMVRTPVGQICPECARARRPVNYQVSPGLLAGVGVLCFFAALAGGFLLAFFLRGFFALIIAFILAPVTGELLVRGLDWLTKAKRGRPMQLTAGISLALGVLPWLWLTSSLSLLLFMIITIATLTARLR